MERHMPEKPIVPIIYHFFPHYRTGVNRELIRSKKYEFLFVGATQSSTGSGIETWDVPKEASFLRTHNWMPGGKVLFQSNIVGVALRKDVKTIVFLGDAQFITTWIAAALARLTGKRVLFWSHGWTARDHGIKKVCRMTFYRLAHGMLLYGHYAKRIGVEMGLRPENLHVIYNSLDYSTQVAMRQSVREEELTQVRASLFGSGAKNPMLICTGRLITARRLDLLLEAMHFLKEEGHPINLLLVGDGPESAALKSQAQHQALAVHFYGACYNEKALARLFMASDMLVMPGPIGLSAMHSLAYGTPVLSHDDPTHQKPEWESIIPGFNGAYFAHNNSRDLARVLCAWFRNAPDRTQMRQHCYEIIERFYNSAMQTALIERALDGKLADDSEWDKFCSERCTSAGDRHIAQPRPFRDIPL